MPHKVIQRATGNIGKHALWALIEHPDDELVGLWAHSPDKVGGDAGANVSFLVDWRVRECC